MATADILHRCFRCGYCKFPNNYMDLNCPSYLKYRFETYSPGGRMWLLRALHEKKITPSKRFQEILFSCTACGNCVDHCAMPGFKEQLLEAFTDGKELLVESGHVPPAVRDYLTSLYNHGNPYKKPAKKRAAWNTSPLDVPAFDGHEYLLFVGDTGSYDPRGMEMTRNVCKILQLLKVSFGILGANERSDGNEALALGESALFESLAQQNIAQFQSLGVKKIIALSPHGYHALKNRFPQMGADLEVMHYTQILARHLAPELAKAQAPTKKVSLCFHDPCYLGRHNKDYGSVRKLLYALPGTELREMSRNRENALCCGGGGGNFYTDMLGSGVDSAARVRVCEAHETGADILATACPKCLIMLEDAVKSENLTAQLVVKDVAEIIATTLSL